MCAIDRRSETRTARRIAVELSSIGESILETTWTQNVSTHGVCVLTRAAWRPDEKVILKSLDGSLYVRALVVRCEYSSENRFTIGLRLLRAVEPAAQ